MWQNGNNKKTLKKKNKFYRPRKLNSFNFRLGGNSVLVHALNSNKRHQSQEKSFFHQVIKF